MEHVILREITQCSPEQQAAVRDVRNQPGIRKAMYTEHEISEAEHARWVEALRTDNRQIIFVVLLDDKVRGVVSLNALDRHHKKSDWAFYLDENTRGGLGAALEYALINYAFDDVNLEKLNCEVIETNPIVVKLHKKFGFVEEGFRRSNVIKDGERVGVHFLGLTKEDWANHKTTAYDMYKAKLDNFEITMEKP